MAIFASFVGLALFLPPLVVLLQRWPGAVSQSPPPTRRQIIWRSAVSGSIGILPIGLLWTLAVYGDWIVLFIVCILGGLYGALVGAAMTWLRARRLA